MTNISKAELMLAAKAELIAGAKAEAISVGLLLDAARANWEIAKWDPAIRLVALIELEAAKAKWIVAADNLMRASLCCDGDLVTAL